MHYLFELFSELLPNPTAADIYTFCRDHFIFAVVIAFVILAVIGAVLLSSLMEFARKIVHVKESRSAKLMMTLFSVAGVLLSVVFVTLILRRLEPIPLFNEGPRTFIREPIVLSWKFNSLSPTERPVYEVENSATSDFSKSTKDIYDGNSLYSYQEEGPRWWRVRAKVGEVNGEIVWSRASRPLQTNYFPNSYSQIKNRGELVVYVSNSVTQGIFRFLKPDGKLGGVDITLSEQIAIALTRELGKPIKARYIPVPWVNLLKMPSSGQADMIISSISNRPGAGI